jgi:hypothetical protein
LTDPTYQSWLQDDPDLLWICGGPGKGKTIMSIFLTQGLERQNEDNIIYYFCNSEDDRNSTSTAILRALIWQIVAKRPELASLVSPYFQSPERTEAVLSTPGILLEMFVKLARDLTMTPMVASSTASMNANKTLLHGWSLISSDCIVKLR